MNTQRIAKNTLLLYFRMFLLMAVSLYTSRIILQALGVEDYGIYNVVGGFVAMLTYLNSALVGGTSRFISYALGAGDENKLKSIFSTSLVNHIVYALFILLVAETFGLWFVNCKLNIDPERMVAANWVYQCSIFSLVISLVCVPFKSCIVAHERFTIYAYVSIMEAVLKLAIAFLVMYLSGDKLIIYALLFLLISVGIPLFYMLYSSKHFDETGWKLHWDKTIWKSMISYSIWQLFGDLGFTFKDQFSNIIMNMFLGTKINAARGVAMQVNGVVMSFARNFITALSPQITQQYAAGNLSNSQRLVYMGSRFSIYLMSIVSIPLLVNIDYVLNLWLEIVPDYTAEFLVITLITNIIYASTNTMTIAIQATGDIKWFQIGISIIMLLELPITYILLLLGFPPYYPLACAIVTNLLGFVFRLLIVKKAIPSYSARRLLFDCLFKSLLLVSVCYGVCYYLNKLFVIHWYTFVLSSILSLLITGSVLYNLGLTKAERLFLKEKALGILHNKVLKKK